MTVTVRSEEVINKLVEFPDGNNAPVVVKLPLVELDPVCRGEDDPDDSDDPDEPDVAEVEELGSPTAGTVTVPKPLRVTATSPVDTETCTAVLASFTLTSTIAAETVTSGLRGTKLPPAFLLTYCGR